MTGETPPAAKGVTEALRKSLERLLLEFDFLVEDGTLPDIRNDVIFVDALAALSLPAPGEGEPISVQDPKMILAGIRQFGLASDGSDLRDLEAAIEALSTPAAGGLAVEALEWSDPTPPTKGVCSYDHCRAKTPFGTYLIEWKSWKDYDDCVVYCPENSEGNMFVACDGTLAGAKAAAQADFSARILSALDRTTLPAAEGEKWQPTHQHVKRGSKYRLDGYGEIQTDAPIGDYCKVAIYRAEDGTTWVRPVSEFEDSRFAALASPQQGEKL